MVMRLVLHAKFVAKGNIGPVIVGMAPKVPRVEKEKDGVIPNIGMNSILMITEMHLQITEHKVGVDGERAKVETPVHIGMALPIIARIFHR